MRLMMRRLGQWVCVMQIFLLVSFLSGTEMEADLFPQNEMAKRSSILIILEPKVFFCPLCVESVVRFIDTLRVKESDCFVTGVFLWKSYEDKENAQKSLRIIEKKIRGFKEGNQIPFPIILDKDHVFQGLDIETPGIIFLDRFNGRMKKYTLPLNPTQLQEIF